MCRYMCVCIRAYIFICTHVYMRASPGSSAGEESTCNAGDPSSIPESGRSPGEGTGYPLQCSWASLVAQMIKNPPAMWETCNVGKISWKRAWQLTPVFLPGGSPWTEEPGGLCVVQGVAWTNELPSTAQHKYTWMYICMCAC